MSSSTIIPRTDGSAVPTHGGNLIKRINNEKDVIHFKTLSPAYKNIKTYVDSLCDLIYGTGNKHLNHKYSISEGAYKKCSEFIDEIEELCDKTNLDQSKAASSLRFGHIAFRDWYDRMVELSKKFVDEKLACDVGNEYKAELLTYLSESFGNRLRIDYGTGHELNFIIFTMGLIKIIDKQASEMSSSGETSSEQTALSAEAIKSHVMKHGWDIIALFGHKYLNLCRIVQKKFRLEPAGSRGVYNMDDFQFLPFLFGVAQLAEIKYISSKTFYELDQVDMWKQDFLFFDAIDFILKNKRGPFNEHSYTLWCLSSLNSWTSIYQRIKTKFIDDVLSPFPIVQHLLFGSHILQWI